MDWSMIFGCAGVSFLVYLSILAFLFIRLEINLRKMRKEAEEVPLAKVPVYAETPSQKLIKKTELKLQGLVLPAPFSKKIEVLSNVFYEKEITLAQALLGLMILFRDYTGWTNEAYLSINLNERTGGYTTLDLGGRLRRDTTLREYLAKQGLSEGKMHETLDILRSLV